MSTSPIPPAAPALMTAEEFLQLHGGECGIDLVKGRIVRDPMPGGEHGIICGEAYSILRDFVKPRDLDRVMTNETFIYAGSNPDSVRGADVAYISYKRLAKDQPVPKGPFEIPFELVIEVRSPSDRMRTVLDKVDDDLEAGVDVVVLLEPTIRVATVYRKDSDQQFTSDDELTLPDILPGFSVPVGKYFE
jgi:Uma2 family endonuclease